MVKDPLDDFNKQFLKSEFLRHYTLGGTPSAFRESIVSAFAPYIRNQNFLEKNAWIWLTEDAVEFRLISSNSNAVSLLGKVVEFYWEAHQKDSLRSLQSAFKWLGKMYENASLSNSWILDLSIRKVTKESVDSEKEIYDHFSDLRLLVEGICKPYLFALYDQLALAEIILNKENPEFMTLGTLVTYLDRVKELGKLTRPGKWQLKLSDWRNISDHFSWKPGEEEIICSYGKGNKKRLIISRDGLLDLVSTVMGNTTALMLAHRLFCVDNTEEAHKLGLIPDVEPNIKVKRFSVKSMISAMGFEVVETVIKEKSISITIRNVTGEIDGKRRRELFPVAILASYLQKNSSVTLNYLGKQGEPNYRVSYEAAGVEAILHKDKPSIQDYIAAATFVDLAI